MPTSNVVINVGAKNAASRVLTKIRGDLLKVNKTVVSLGRDASESLRGFGRGLKTVGVGMTALGGATAAAVGVSVKAFADFDDRMLSVQAKATAGAKSMTDLREEAKRLGRETRFSAVEAASGMEMLAQAGFDTQQIFDGIGPTLALAAAGAVELKEAADIASDVGTAFNLSASEIARVADVMATAATSANTDILMMGETFKHVAPVALVAGQSLEETSVAIGLLANSGVKASMAGTDIKNLLTRLAKPAREGAAAIKRLGLEFKTADGEFKPLMDIMADFGEKTANLSGPDKLAEATRIFGLRAAKSAVILSTKMGPEVESMRGKMEEAEGAAMNMAETMESGLGGVFRRIISASEGVKIAIGEAFAGSLQNLGDQISDTLVRISQWIGKNQSLVRGLVVAGGIIGGLGATLITVGAGFTAMGFAVAGVTAAISALGTIIGIVLTPVGAVVAGITVGVVALGAAFASVAIEMGVLGIAIEHGKQLFGTLLQTASRTLTGISDAISSGDIELAFRIGMAGAKVAMLDGLQDILRATEELIPVLWEAWKEFFRRWATTAVQAAGVVTSAVTGQGGGAAAKLGALLAGLSSGGPGGGGGLGFALTNAREDAHVEFNRLLQQAREKREKAEDKEGKAQVAEQKTTNDKLDEMIDVLSQQETPLQGVVVR